MVIAYSPLFFPLFTWVFSLMGTYVALYFLSRGGVLDTVSARSNHSVPTPRGGGIAMVLAAILFLWAAGLWPFVLCAALLVAAVSFADDLRGAPVWLRLLVQCIAVGSSACLLPFPPSPPLPFNQLWLLPLVALLWLWFVNLTNFMDGIDGITCTEVISICIGICFVCAAIPEPHHNHAVTLKTMDLLHRHAPFPFPALALHASIIAAATLGFYWFNRSPARLFIGDVGAVTLGFLLGYLLLSLALLGEWAPALILPAYYLADASFTLLKRLLKREKVWQAHSQHAYQQAVRAGLSHTAVTCRIFALNILLVVLALGATLHMITGLAAVLAAYALTALLIYRFTHHALPPQ